MPARPRRRGVPLDLRFTVKGRGDEPAKGGAAPAVSRDETSAWRETAQPWNSPGDAPTPTPAEASGAAPPTAPVAVVPAPPAAGPRRAGVCQWYDPGTRRGFVRPDDGGRDLVLRESDCQSPGIAKGDRVTFVVVDNDGAETAADVAVVTDPSPSPIVPSAAPQNSKTAEIRAVRAAYKVERALRSAARAGGNDAAKAARIAKFKAEKADVETEVRAAWVAAETARLEAGRRGREHPPPPATPGYATGTVQWYTPKKKYGFIDDGGGRDIFVHAMDLRFPGTDLAEGDRVEYKRAPYKNREKAVDVSLCAAPRPPEPAPAPPPPADPARPAGSLEAYLTALGLGAYVAKFRAEEITSVADLAYLTVDDFEDIGLPRDDATALARYGK